MTDLANAVWVMLVAALPLSELRGAIPLAMVSFQFDPVTAYLLSVLGNLLPMPLLLTFLEPVTKLLRRISLLNRFLSWLFARTRRKHSAAVARWGAFALVLFVAIPLPTTGAWTGAIVAHIFGIPLRSALPLIALGVLIAGVLVVLGTLGILTLLL